MTDFFELNRSTKIQNKHTESKPTQNAINIFKRDMEAVLEDNTVNTKNEIVIDMECGLSVPEQFIITAENNSRLVIKATDDLGVIYGLLYISEKYLGVAPFDFWNENKPKKLEKALIPFGEYISKPAAVRYRGWFVNDEVLLTHWNYSESNKDTWFKVFETLLRCHGNMVIPGTSLNDDEKREWAYETGLWITHHHATPLGAEMFNYAFPGKAARYYENSTLFEKLWEQAVLNQKDKKVVWSVGFRGQGDGPFWHNDNTVVTSEARGKLIGDVIKKQCEIVRRYVKHPVLCTNLYSEMAELYKQGYIDLPADVIKVWADNGYGKMVTRRNGNTDYRVHALPLPEDAGSNGIYFHASFHDLQASNHMTMSPVSPEFVLSELNKCFEVKASDFWVINCSNIKPHAYMLDLIREMWQNGTADADSHLRKYIKHYYGLDNDGQVFSAFKDYFECVIPFGNEIDQKGGEQFYNYTVRNIIKAWLQNGTEKPIDSLKWVAGDGCMREQITLIIKKCKDKMPHWINLQDKTKDINLLSLHVKTHRYGCEGLIQVCESYNYYINGQYAKAYVTAFDAFRSFDSSRKAFLSAGNGIWNRFYENDCLTNVAATAYSCKTLYKFIRVANDNVLLNEWERRYLFDKRSKDVMLLSAYDNALNDEQLFEGLKDVLFSGTIVN